MKLKIAVLAGDGIGPEIMEQGVAVMSAVAEKFGHEVSYKEALCGAHAIDEVGDPFPEETFKTCEEADAVLFASVGDPKFDNNPSAKVRPEQGLLAMRKKLGLFANIRPVTTFDCLVHKSPLKDEIVKGLTLSAFVNLLVVCTSVRSRSLQLMQKEWKMHSTLTTTLVQR